MNEPKRHHYIPQFILKNFLDENNQIHYFNIASSKIEKRNTKSIFMKYHLYRDDKNNPENPTIIEQKFGLLENKIAIIINDKILNKRTITLTM